MSDISNTNIEITQPVKPSAAYEEGRLAWHNELLPDECPYLFKWNAHTLIEAYEWIQGWSDVARSDTAYMNETIFDSDGE